MPLSKKKSSNMTNNFGSNPISTTTDYLEQRLAPLP
jgi:hypothetical protein